jgi:hypothetical protein
MVEAGAPDRMAGTVGENNLGAQLWLRVLGFRAVGVERGWSGDEAGYRFEWLAPKGVPAQGRGR